MDGQQVSVDIESQLHELRPRDYTTSPTETLHGMVCSDRMECLGYATIILKGRNTGVLADSTGYFSLPLNRAYPGDSIVVRYVGFKPQTIALADLNYTTFNDTITLIECMNTLPEITVRPHNYKIVRKGKKHKKGMFKAFLDVNELAGETFGFEFHSKRGHTLWIDKIGFYIEKTDNTMKRMKFRVNIYDMSNVHGDISDKFENILSFPIFFEYHIEEIIDGKYIYNLPNLIKLPKDAMVEIEALENREGEEFIYYCNLFGKESWSKTLDGKDLWIKSKFALPFFIDCAQYSE